jgi:pSer/pThr/pTyr-binding forkhead associated (FHA) protein
VPLTGEEVVIGRHKDCNLRIIAKDVSRRHCTIRNYGDRVTLSDLGSTNGTYVNGRPVMGERWLQFNDELQIGSALFRLEEGAVSAAPDATMRLDDVDIIDLRDVDHVDLDSDFSGEEAPSPTLKEKWVATKSAKVTAPKGTDS